MATEFLMALPVVAVVAAIGLGLTGSTLAGALGAACAIVVALAAAPVPFGIGEATVAVGRGAWQTALVGAVIVGGLFFRAAAEKAMDGGPAGSLPPWRARSRLYAACFLVGPFIESSTGFGVGQVTAIAMIRDLGPGPLHVALLGLFSQTMVSWGAFANGTMIGSQLSGVPPVDLGVRSALLNAPVLLGWLGTFWWAAASSGVRVGAGRHAAELGWTILSALLLAGCNLALGPEVAGLASLGPLAVVHFLVEGRPDRARAGQAARAALPYIVLVAGLAASRAVPVLNRTLAGAVSFQPFQGGPELRPLLHPGSWLLVLGCAAALTSGAPRRLHSAGAEAWRRGRRPVLTILFFLTMAQIMSASGMAGSLANALRNGLGSAAVLAVPSAAGLFGLLTSSSNASNGLLMPSLAALALDSGASLPWLAAVQNTAAASLTMLSPVRLAMGCALVGRPDLERPLYQRAWPLGAVPVAVLTVAAAVVAFLSRR